jgi:uncharacterized protein (DUF2062 family)
MWHYSRTALRRWAESLLHTHDTPERTATAIGLGVAIGFSPFLGFHLLIGIVLAFFFNLNRVAVLAGVCVNLPWVMGAYYAATTALGTWILGTRIPPNLTRQLQLAWSLPHWGARVDALADLLQPLLWPFTLGSLIGGVLLGVVTYYVALPVLVTIHRHRLHSLGLPTAKPADNPGDSHS